MMNAVKEASGKNSVIAADRFHVAELYRKGLRKQEMNRLKKGTVWEKNTIAGCYVGSRESEELRESLPAVYRRCTLCCTDFPGQYMRIYFLQNGIVRFRNRAEKQAVSGDSVIQWDRGVPDRSEKLSLFPNPFAVI